MKTILMHKIRPLGNVSRIDTPNRSSTLSLLRSSKILMQFSISDSSKTRTHNHTLNHLAKLAILANLAIWSVYLVALT